MAEPRPLDISTRAVTVGRPAAEPDAPLNVPVTLASTYVAGGEAEYGRYANPTWTAFEDALGDLEGGRCLAFASGMAAIAAVLDLLPAGARVVAPRHSYTGTIASSATPRRAAGSSSTSSTSPTPRPSIAATGMRRCSGSSRRRTRRSRSRTSPP